MQFTDPRVARVFALYEARVAEDHTRMQALGPAGYAQRDQFLLPIGPEAGGLLHALILAKRPRRILELGTSYGYSTLFIADAAREIGAQVISMDMAGYKQDYARGMLEAAGLAAEVEFRCGDAIELIPADPESFDLVLLDIWKDLYIPCLEAVLPKLTDGGIILADNMLQPEIDQAAAQAYQASVRSRKGIQSLLLDVGSGLELSIKWNATPMN